MYFHYRFHLFIKDRSYSISFENFFRQPEHKQKINFYSITAGNAVLDVIENELKFTEEQNCENLRTTIV